MNATTPKKIKTLLFSTLYPSSVRPVHGIFVETRLRELLKSGAVETGVIAPVPWFPFKGIRFGDYGKFAATPAHEHRNGIEVFHPRYFLPPKVGMNIAPLMLALGALPTARRLIQQGFDFDLIDAHYYYPDGVAAAMLACWLNKPFVVTARGTDLNLIPQYSYPRRLILQTAEKAAASIGVCQALMDSLTKLGADPAKHHVFRNGVDLELFHPKPRDIARQYLKLPAERRLLLSIGHLVERKGHHIAIAALPYLATDIDLAIIGSGPEETALRKLVEQKAISHRVHFVGQIPQTQLPEWYSAADVLVLCSSREGWANVLLESMASGTPVVATNIWGTPEVVSVPEAGVLMRERTPQALTEAVEKLFACYPDRMEVRHHAEQFSWDQTTQDQLTLFHKIFSVKRHEN